MVYIQGRGRLLEPQRSLMIKSAGDGILLREGVGRQEKGPACGEGVPEWDVAFIDCRRGVQGRGRAYAQLHRHTTRR